MIKKCLRGDTNRMQSLWAGNATEKAFIRGSLHEVDDAAKGASCGTTGNNFRGNGKKDAKTVGVLGVLLAVITTRVNGAIIAKMAKDTSSILVVLSIAAIFAIFSNTVKVKNNSTTGISTMVLMSSVNLMDMAAIAGQMEIFTRGILWRAQEKDTEC